MAAITPPAADPVTAVANTVTAALGLTGQILDPSLQSRIDDLHDEYRATCEAFCAAVEAGDADACTRLIDGLRVNGPLPRLADGDLVRLRGITPRIDGALLANLFVRAAGGDFAARVADLHANDLRATKS